MNWYPVLCALLIVGALLSWPTAGPESTRPGRAGRGVGEDPDGDPGHDDRTGGSGVGRARRWRRASSVSSAPSSEDVATTCELVALALSAGAGVGDALEAVARDAPPQVRGALAAVVAGRRWGLPEEQVWAFPGERWAPLVRALHLAEAAGVPPSGPLRQAAADLRVGRTHRLEVATARLRVRIVLPLGLCFLPAFVLTSVVPVVLALAARLSQP
ncbi:Type II secretion system (T2SS), protein F [Austwickia chelonae]|uniref:Type II secretion system protein GspF domain-containing protein n=1 Tax=Austwickia chelonae NBRC 105200 TaxID=1184607 RepID=K6VNV0_9MICO|nr:type II secretion system F family protein [Austwickia chelonae]GAB77025.1 hypothetical protein AUCHE_04_00660 [Austwickia chelonae NBRC 105200]SEW33364.1 Type II secretion system (T2SS), protein F [Austwickia chelonae]